MKIKIAMTAFIVLMYFGLIWSAIEQEDMRYVYIVLGLLNLWPSIFLLKTLYKTN